MNIHRKRIGKFHTKMITPRPIITHIMNNMSLRASRRITLYLSLGAFANLLKPFRSLLNIFRTPFPNLYNEFGKSRTQYDEGPDKNRRSKDCRNDWVSKHDYDRNRKDQCYTTKQNITLELIIRIIPNTFETSSNSSKHLPNPVSKPLRTALLNRTLE